jgi:hypothetical protein
MAANEETGNLTSLGNVTFASGRKTDHHDANARVLGHDAEAVNLWGHLC